MLNEQERSRVFESAVLARDRAYAPYSRFKVGCALLDRNGRIHLGCNVENAAYSPTQCAERTALCRAVADGVRPGEFAAIAIVGDAARPVAPCGVCRQVMIELCPPDMPVLIGNLAGQWISKTVADLLPDAFGPDMLQEDE